MKSTFWTLLILLLSLNSYSQFTFLYEKTYGEHEEIAKKTIETDDGFLMTIGYQVKGENSDIFVRRTTPQGEIIWSKLFGGQKREFGHSIKQSKDGNFICAGTWSSNGTHGGSDWYLFKLDNKGNLLWQKVYGSKENEYITDIEETVDGKIAVCGAQKNKNRSDQDALIALFDHNGNIEWENKFGNHNNEELKAIAVHKDEIVAVGSTTQKGQQLDWLILKYNTKRGKLIWKKTYGSRLGNDIANDIILNHNNNYIVCGKVRRPHTQTDLWIKEIDQDGNHVWGKYLGHANSEGASSIIEYEPGVYILAGFSRDEKRGYNGYLMKIDQRNGTITHDDIWEKSYGSEYWDEFYDIIRTKDSGILLSGYTKNYVDSATIKQYKTRSWTLKLLPTELYMVQNQDFPVKFTEIDYPGQINKSHYDGDNTLVIIAGINNYQNINYAKYADRDAQLANLYFQNLMNIPQNNIIMLQNHEATYDSIANLISINSWLHKNIHPKTTKVILYYAGHGTSDFFSEEPKNYILPYDYNYSVSNDEQQAFEIKELCKSILDFKPKDLIVFIDACFSGLAENGPLVHNIRFTPKKVKYPELNKENITVFTSSKDIEFSNSSDEYQHGIFTYYLFKGLNGEADKNRDSTLTYIELQKYLEMNIPKLARELERIQNPYIFGQKEGILLQYK